MIETTFVVDCFASGITLLTKKDKNKAQTHFLKNEVKCRDNVPAKMKEGRDEVTKLSCLTCNININFLCPNYPNCYLCT